MPAKNDKEDKILRVLRSNPQGLWVRGIAREANLDKSTVSRHLEALHEHVSFRFLGRNKVYSLRGAREKE